MNSLIVPRVDVNAETEPRADELGQLDSEGEVTGGVAPARLLGTVQTHPRGNGELDGRAMKASEARLAQVLGW